MTVRGLFSLGVLLSAGTLQAAWERNAGTLYDDLEGGRSTLLKRVREFSARLGRPYRFELLEGESRREMTFKG
ncbi:hypothetical protein ACIQUS_11165 [Pseudomonas sp. NPDC090755]|uniref:hypothetical protein n=1 Tax=Pseudomonas sp. NPDC090755 TaxID=3364481 RepID=UPI00383A7196